MSTEHHILARIEATLSGYRDTIARLTPELAHLREEKVIIMQFMSEMGSALKTLISARQASDARADAAEAKAASEGNRADTAEADNAALKSQIAADEASLKDMLGEVNAEIEKEQPAPSFAPVTSTSPTGATVTVDPSVGTTTHVDGDTTTTVPHDGSAPTAVDTSVTPAQPVEPPPAAVAEAVAASADAGVTVPAQG